jgi:hypothetical protein
MFMEPHPCLTVPYRHPARSGTIAAKWPSAPSRSLSQRIEVRFTRFPERMLKSVFDQFVHNPAGKPPRPEARLA